MKACVSVGPSPASRVIRVEVGQRHKDAIIKFAWCVFVCVREREREKGRKPSAMMQAYVVLGGTTLQSHDSSVPLALLPTDGWMELQKLLSHSTVCFIQSAEGGGGVFHIVGKMNSLHMG